MPRKAKKKARKKTNKKARKRHSDKQKSALLTNYHNLVQAGDTAQKAAKKVGVTYTTLHNWEKRSGKKKPSRKKTAGKKAVRAAFKKAVAVPRGKKKRGRKPGSLGTGGLTLVTPAGFRIEGISTRELIRVLKDLK